MVVLYSCRHYSPAANICRHAACVLNFKKTLDYVYAVSERMCMNLKAARQEADMTLEALASCVKSTKGYLSEIENGLKQPSLGMALKLKKHLPTLALDTLISTREATQ